MSILTAQDITFTYPGTNVPALDRLTLTVEKGEILFLLGVNGSGKTTLLHHLNGLLRPGSGAVSLHGMLLGRYREKDLFSKVGLVFQDPNDQLFAPTVEEDVIFGPRNLGENAQKSREMAAEALATVGLDGYGPREVRTLSYGQKKRAALAGILVMNPEVLLLDEPTAGIDPVGAVRIMELVRALNESKQLTVIVTTHDVDLAAVFAHRVCILDKGQVVRTGPAADVLSDTVAMRQAGLRLPRIAHLAEILRDKDHVDTETLPLTIGQARKWIKDRLGNNR